MLAVVRHGPGFLEKSTEPVQGYASRLPWAWDGLCFAVPFNDSSQQSARDLVANAAPSEWSGSPTWTADNRGNTALLLDSTSYIGYADNPIHNKPSTALTVYVRLRRAGSPTPPKGIAGKVYAPPFTDPWTTWGIQSTDTDTVKLATSITVGGVNNYFENTSYSTDTTTWLSVFTRWRSGSTLTQDVLGEHGQLYSTVSSGTITGTLSYPGTSYPLRINALDDPAGNHYAAYSQVLVWSRRLTDTEVQALVSDPFGWYAPRRETVVIGGAFPLILGAGEMHMTGISGGGMT